MLHFLDGLDIKHCLLAPIPGGPVEQRGTDLRQLQQKRWQCWLGAEPSNTGKNCQPAGYVQNKGWPLSLGLGNHCPSRLIR